MNCIKLKEIMNQQNISVRELSKKTHISFKTLYRRLSEPNTFNLRELYNIFDALNIDSATAFVILCDESTATIKVYSTKDLINELQNREGVKIDFAEPHEDKSININGPATIITVID